MPLGRVYIPPPTTPIKYGSEFAFPKPQHVGNNKFSSKFNHTNNNSTDEEDDFLIKTKNMKNKLNDEATNCAMPLSFNYNVDINGESESDRASSQNSGKEPAFRKIEIKILDTKYYDNDNDKIEPANESYICNGNASEELEDQYPVSKYNDISTNDSTPRRHELDNSSEKEDNDEKVSSLSVNTYNNNVDDHNGGLDLNDDTEEEGKTRVSIENDYIGAKDNSIIQRGMNNHYLDEETCQDSDSSPQNKEQDFDIKTIKCIRNSFANNSKGLKNLGNTCFMNSIIQCLASTKPLLEFCLSFLDNQPSAVTPSNKVYTGSLSAKSLNAGPLAQTKMTKSFVSLLEDMWNLKNKSNSSSGSNHGIADPSNYRLSVTKFAPKFSGFDQHDSQEFLQYALEGFHTELNRVKKNDDKCNSKTTKDSCDIAAKDKNENIINDSTVVDSNCDSLNGNNDINNNENSTSASHHSSSVGGSRNGVCDTMNNQVHKIKTSKPRTYEEILDDPNLSGEEKGEQCLDVYLSKDNSFITDLFLGQFRSTLQCCVCCHESITFEPFWLISVPIPSSKDWKGDAKRTVIDCMQEFTKIEVLDGDEKPTCEKCKERRKCKKWYSVEKWPKILVIHLKRFAPGGSYRPKICCVVDVPLRNLNFSKFSSSSHKKSKSIDSDEKTLINGDCSSEEEDFASENNENVENRSNQVVELDDEDEKPKVLYDCYAISNHSGTLGGGHYTAYCRHPFKNGTEEDGYENFDSCNDSWHLYNDRTVSKSSAENVISGDAYLLFFEKI